MIARGEVEDGPEPAQAAHARAIEMAVIERTAELGMIIHVEIGMAELEKTADGALGLAGGDVLGVIGAYRAGGCQECDAPALGTFARRDEEGDVVLPVAVSSSPDLACRAGAALGADGILSEADGSQRVIEIIMMEVDGAIVLGLQGPAMLSHQLRPFWRGLAG